MVDGLASDNGFAALGRSIAVAATIPTVFVSDLRHFLDMPDDAPAPARRMAEHLARIVEAGTASPAGEPLESSVRCTRRPRRRPCEGLIGVMRLDVPPSIEWRCPVCGDDGVVSGWEGSMFDLRRSSPDVDGHDNGLKAQVRSVPSDPPVASVRRVSGRWRITEMELWDQDAIDLAGPGFIEFGFDDSGSFRFIAVEAWMDVRHSDQGGRPGVEFSWEGHDDGERTSGRGWASLAPDGTLFGRIFIHLGDDSSFVAVAEADTSHRGRGFGPPERHR